MTRLMWVQYQNTSLILRYLNVNDKILTLSSSPPTLTMTWTVPADLRAVVLSQQTLDLLEIGRVIKENSFLPPNLSGRR